MKIARRRSLRSTPETIGETPAESAEPVAPRGAPVAAFAGILDGQSLWVAVDLTPGAVALRRTDTGDVVALSNDAPDDQPAYTSARMNLGGLSAPAPTVSSTTYDVVIVPTNGRAPRPVWSTPLPEDRVAPARDERTQWDLLRTDEGFLQITRSDLEPAAWLTGVSDEPAGVRLTFTAGDPNVPAPQVALLADGEPLALFPTSLSPTGDLAVLIDADPAIDSSLDVQTRVVVGAPGAWVPIRRRHDDLSDPGRGAPLPPVNLPGTETPRIRLRFGGEAFLVARILPVTDSAGGVA